MAVRTTANFRVTYQDFEDYGIDRHAIPPALAELAALGIIEITQRGRAGNAEWRTPNKFRLCYRPSGNAKPTHEWKSITSIEEAQAIARHARSGHSAKKARQIAAAA